MRSTLFLSLMPCFKIFTAIYFLKEQFLKLESQAYINAYGFGNSQIFLFFFLISVFSTKLQIYTNLPAREPKPANSTFFSLIGSISSWCYPQPVLAFCFAFYVESPHGPAEQGSNLGVQLNSPIHRAAQLPARLPRLGVCHGCCPICLDSSFVCASLLCRSLCTWIFSRSTLITMLRSK